MLFAKRRTSARSSPRSCAQPSRRAARIELRVPAGPAGRRARPSPGVRRRAGSALVPPLGEICAASCAHLADAAVDRERGHRMPADSDPAARRRRTASRRASPASVDGPQSRRCCKDGRRLSARSAVARRSRRRPCVAGAVRQQREPASAAVIGVGRLPPERAARTAMTARVDRARSAPPAASAMNAGVTLCFGKDQFEFAPQPLRRR